MITMTTLKNRQEWLENRKHTIGGSEIASILGLNPYTDNQKLFLAELLGL